MCVSSQSSHELLVWLELNDETVYGFFAVPARLFLFMKPMYGENKFQTYLKGNFIFNETLSS